MGVTVLIAEDEKELLESMAMLLGDLGYKVYSALDGASALGLLKEKKPDILILDISMPRIGGEEVLRELASSGFHTKVIISTGHTVQDQNLKDRILKEFKVSAFLEKPSSIDEIDYVIKEVLKEES